MLFEHLIYSTAIAIIAGMVWYKRTGRDPSWIIIASAYAPDFDIFAGYIFKKFNVGVLINDVPLHHGNFHNIAVLLIYAAVVALLLRTIRMKFKDSFIFAGIGFGAHIFEDMLVFKSGYEVLWPISKQVLGIGLIDYKPDFYGIANTEVLIAGVIALILCGAIRNIFKDGTDLRKITQGVVAACVFMFIAIPAILIYNDSLKENIRASDIIDNWQSTKNASWDPTIFHNGTHSARIEILGNVSSTSGIWKSNKIPVKPDTNYTFSAWGKIERVGGNPPAVRVVELDADARLIRHVNLAFNNGTHNWSQKKIVFKTRSNASWVYVYGNIWKGYGTFWFDDVELCEEGTDKNIISNGGFELSAKKIIDLYI